MQIDGIEYEIDWERSTKGTSIFVPCLDAVQAQRAILREAKARRRKLAIRIAIEGGVQGVRAWRIT